MRVRVEDEDGADGETRATSCAARKGRTEAGAMPAKVSDSIRATVMAGLANDVLLVDQYAAVMWPPTAYATWEPRPDRTAPKTTSSSPKVATASASSRRCQCGWWR